MLQGKRKPLTILFLKVTKNRMNLVKIASLQTGLCSGPSFLPKNLNVVWGVGKLGRWLSFGFICRVMEVEDVRGSRRGSWVGTQIIVIVDFWD